MFEIPKNQSTPKEQTNKIKKIHKNPIFRIQQRGNH